MIDPLPLSWEVCLHMLGPHPVAFAVATPCKSGYGNTTREPTAEERARIRGWLRRFVLKHGTNPVGSFDVKGVKGPVLFRRVWQ
jgi:hypothetical protein